MPGAGFEPATSGVHPPTRFSTEDYEPRTLTRLSYPGFQYYVDSFLFKPRPISQMEEYLKGEYEGNPPAAPLSEGLNKNE